MPGTVAGSRVPKIVEQTGSGTDQSSTRPRASSRHPFAGRLQSGRPAVHDGALVHDATHRIDTLSMSVAFPEDDLSSNDLDVASRAFLEAAALGVSAFASAGDYGSSRDIPDGLAHVEFPSASPWVTSVGGTRLPGGEPIGNETVWDDYKINDGFLSGGKGATGGGVSNHFAVPGYQRGLDIRSANPGHRAGRGGPDVATIADREAGLEIYANGAFFSDGGTSAAAPAWAALAARINQELGRNVGFDNPLIYGPLGSSDAFHDITRGDTRPASSWWPTTKSQPAWAIRPMPAGT